MLDTLAYTTRDEDPDQPKQAFPDDPDFVPFDSDHPWELNREIFRRQSKHPAARSFREVERELETIRRVAPSVHRWIYDLFLHPEAGDADYDRLKNQVESGAASPEQRKRLIHVSAALHALTWRLIDTDLYAVFPSRYLPGKRGETMEENYRGIHRIFVQECKQHAKTMKRYRKKAHETTAEICDCGVATVKRAVHFVESVEGETMP